MSWLLVIHVVCAGLWLGCVLVEVTFERVLAGLQTREFLAKLHYWVDLLIELPAFLIVLATGQQMLNSATPTVPLHVMTGAGPSLFLRISIVSGLSFGGAAMWWRATWRAMSAPIVCSTG